jgi:glucose-1-phosphate thymidylyltransferase
MITVLLCAGYATRMYPLTKNLPKSLLSVAGKPVIDYFMEQLCDLSQTPDVHVVTNDRFVSHFEKWRREWLDNHPFTSSFKLKIHNDGSTGNENRLGACGDLAWVLKRLPQDSPMLVAAGDNIFRFSIKPLWDRFVERDGHWIIGLPETDEKKLRRTGVLEFGENDRVLRLHEKPSNPPSVWSCPAIYFFERSVVSTLDEFLNVSDKTDAPGYFIDFLCQKDHVYAFRVNATRFDIGSIDDYRKADKRLGEEPLFLSQ